MWSCMATEQGVLSPCHFQHASVVPNTYCCKLQCCLCIPEVDHSCFLAFVPYSRTKCWYRNCSGCYSASQDRKEQRHHWSMRKDNRLCQVVNSSKFFLTVIGTASCILASTRRHSVWCASIFPATAVLLVSCMSLLLLTLRLNGCLTLCDSVIR